MSMMTLKFAGAAVAALAVGVLVAAGPGAAQQPGPNAGPPGPNGPAGQGPGMSGPRRGGDMGMMPARPGRFMCDERASAMSQRRLARIERIVKPTDAQRAAFADFKTASAKAMDVVKAACPTETFLTPTGRLESAEKQMEARLQAIRTVRPALENFYKSLSDEQKAHFNALRAHHGPRWAGGDWRARFHHMWQNFRDHNRGAWRDRGSDDRGSWRRRGDNRQGSNDGRDDERVYGRGDRQDGSDGRGERQGRNDDRGGGQDGNFNRSSDQGEEHL